MALSLQGFGTLVSNASATMQGACTTLIDLTVGSVVRALLEACASVALWLQYLTLQVLLLTRLSTSTGSDVDSWVADFGLVRLPATPATGAVTLMSLNPASQAATVPDGTGTQPAATVRTSIGISFQVTTDTTNPAYSATAGGYIRPAGTASITVPIQAAVGGSAGNVPAGAINLLGTSISGIDTCNNALALTNGDDPETDPALRARFVAFINTRSQGTLAAIGEAILSVQVGLSYAIAEDQDPSGAARPGIITAYVDDGSGDPPAALLTKVATAIEIARAAGIVVFVQPPSVLPATVSLTISVQAGTVLATAEAAVQAAIDAFIGGLGIGGVLPYSRLTGLAYAANPGVVNVTNVLLNGGAADIGGGPSQVVRAARVTVGP